MKSTRISQARSDDSPPKDISDARIGGIRAHGRSPASLTAAPWRVHVRNSILLPIGETLAQVQLRVLGPGLLSNTLFNTTEHAGFRREGVKMKQLLLMLAPLMFVALWATYNDTVSGSQTAAPQSQGIALNLTASGDLPGMSKVTLQRDGQNITGGTLKIIVLPQNADANSTERGELAGTIGGGTLTLTADGTLASASSVQISIQSGTGEFAAVTSGSATLNITANADNPSQLSGTLALNF